ncbi:hypothetical protein [Dactylosporangium darangshiense]|uniref:hypothetical protein n=1 Tax=Dactylosporangium darangshiense TaxID=579108 RepID=UPI0031E99B76
MVALAAVVTCLAACSKPGFGEVLTVAGWAPDGSVVAATELSERPATLYSGAAGGKLRRVPFEYCQPDRILSTFPLSSGRVGLTVVCGEWGEVQLEAERNGLSAPRAVRFVSLEWSTGRVEQLAAIVADPGEAAVSIEDGVWSEPAGAAFVGYASGCPGIGRLDSDGNVQPLALTVPMPGGSVSLASELPPPGGSGCAAHALASRIAIIPNGQHLAFFAHRCDGWCTGVPEFDGEWFVVVHDLVRQTVRVLPGGFSSPHALALTDSGAIAVSARHGEKKACGCARTARIRIAASRRGSRKGCSSPPSSGPMVAEWSP